MSRWRIQYTRQAECDCGYFLKETYTPGRHLPKARVDRCCTKCGRVDSREISDTESINIAEEAMG